MPKPILCLDFDGVCHSYTSGWQGADVIPDAPVDGLWDFLDTASTHFDLAIFSSRSGQTGGRRAMLRWFAKHCPRYGISEELGHSVSWYATDSDARVRLTFPENKPPAFLSIDDRALLFTGVWPDIPALQTFKPWNKQ